MTWIMMICLMERRQNEDTRKDMDVLCIPDESRKITPPLFGHGVRREEDNTIKKARRLSAGGKHSRVRQSIGM